MQANTTGPDAKKNYEANDSKYRTHWGRTSMAAKITML